MSHPRTTQALLYYGIEDSEEDCSIYHAFQVEDPAVKHDDERIAVNLARQLDCEPDADNFQMRSMYVDLPESLICRIQEEAVADYLRNNAEGKEAAV